ncbi:hypothetical protein SDD30_05415 [Moorella naiadis]|uniref:hypothetical protein n=1 Tax=Moorella naiadis (nom. illeg.) TaxID=3093670 RepID=UPI003D9CAB8C
MIPDLIEVGVDILNPIQFKTPNMDAARLKKEFGDALTFWGGGIDTQYTLPRGTPGEVRDEVKRQIDILAPGGGFVFNTVYNIQATSRRKISSPCWKQCWNTAYIKTWCPGFSHQTRAFAFLMKGHRWS